MRRFAVILLVVLAPGLARAACPDVPPSDASGARSLSDVPYEQSAPCPPPQPRGAASSSASGSEGWTAPSSNWEMTPTRAGLMITALGSLVLVSGVSFAICARHGPTDGARGFCHDARAPTLIAGGVIAAAGLATLAVTAFADRHDSPSGRTELVAGLQLRVALAPAR